MKKSCDTCVMDKVYCHRCIRHPDYKLCFDYYRAYLPTCKFENADCIHDPAYIKCYYPDWYQSLYGNKTPEEASLDPEGCANCKNGEDYDDEDK